MDQKTADAIVEELISDLNDRKGFDTGDIDDDTMDGWKAAWARIIMDGAKKRS